MSSCSVGRTGPDCAYCDAGFWLNSDRGAQNVCYRCPSNTWGLVLLYVFCIQLFCIVLAVLNVQSGANRKSIHSLVVKLMLAYAASWSTFSDFLSTTLLTRLLPSWLSPSKEDGESSTHSFSPFTVLRFGFLQCLSNGNSFPVRFRDGVFYHTLLPFIAALFATVTAGALVAVMIPLRRRGIDRRLRLLHMLKQKSLFDTAQTVSTEINETRSCHIWHIAAADQSIGVVFWVVRFLKDMIPPYIVIGVVFYNSLLARQASLLICRRDDVTGVLHSKFAPGVLCSPTDANFKYFLIYGLVFTIFWGVGLPVACVVLILPHSQHLNDPDILQKYGFLHNGYEPYFWFAELFFFARKAGINLATIFAHSDNEQYKLTLFFALGFLVLHAQLQPFDKRNNNAMTRLDIGCLVIWTVSLTLTILGDTLAGAEREILATFVLVMNLALIIYMTVVLYRETCNWARSASSNHSFLSPVIKLLASRANKHKEREPRVLLNESRNEIALGATGKSRRNRRLIVQLYKNGIPMPPRRRAQSYFISCVNDTFIYFLKQLKADRISGEMCMYIVRMALVSSSLSLAERERVNKLSDMPESEYAQFVDRLRQEEIRRQREELLKVQKLQRELDAYFAGKDTSSMKEFDDKAIKVDDDNGSRTAPTRNRINVPLPALFDSPALKQTLPLPDFCTLLYKFRQTTGDPSHFEQYRVIKFIHDRKQAEDTQQRWSELVNITRSLRDVSSDQRTISIDHKELETLDGEILRYDQYLALLNRTIEYCIFRPLDFASILLAVEDLGNDPLQKRIERIRTDNAAGSRHSS